MSAPVAVSREPATGEPMLCAHGEIHRGERPATDHRQTSRCGILIQARFKYLANAGRREKSSW